MKMPIKAPAEIKLVRFQFSDEIEPGLTITNVTLSSEVHAGSDSSAAAMLDGVPIVDNTNLYVLQRVKDGLADCDYLLQALATDSSGLKHLVYGFLPVRNPS